jgi:hypothetical protein
MRTMLLLVAMLALGASNASAQDVCIQGYQSCMQACGNQGSQSAVNNCVGMCQRNNDSCSEKSWGPYRGPLASSGPAPQNTQARAPAQAPAREQAAAPAQREPKAELRNGVRVEVPDDEQPAQK